MKINLIVIMLSWLLSSCSDYISSIDCFESKTTNLSSKILSSEKVLTRYPYRIRQQDSVLFVMDLHGTEFYCHRLCYPSMQSKKSFALDVNNDQPVVEFQLTID